MSEADTIRTALDAGMNLGSPKQHTGCKPYAIVPGGNGEAAVLEYLEPEAKPQTVRACPNFDDADSLISYIKDFDHGNTRIFANVDKNTIASILDYHRPEGSTERIEQGAEPNWCRHGANFTAKHSEEWKLWIGRNAKHMSQTEFAQFIEDNAVDIVRPDGATMLEVALSIEASKSGSFKSAKRMQNGDMSFSYVEETNATAGKQSLEVPKDFDVQLRPFLGCSHHKVTARLRYRIDNGELRLWYELLRHEDVKRLAFDAIVAKVQDETGIKVLLGSA